MAKFQVDKAVFDTEKAKARWSEASDWNGSNHISRATGSQWNHQTLYQSAKGRYYIVNSSNYQGVMDEIELISPKAAARWLILNDHDLPDDLAGLADEVVE